MTVTRYSENMLQVKNITFDYSPVKRRSLFSPATEKQPSMTFDLTVEPGEILAILGPSGSGKSTLLNLIAGFSPLQSGDICFEQVSIAALPPAQRPITTLFQEHNLFNHLTVRQNIAIGLAPGLKLTTEQTQRVEDAASQVGLADLLDRLPGSLSGGQRQRVGIARCLARKKPLLLLDEPFSALDPALRKEMLRLIKALNQTQGITVLMVSHSPDDALQIADRVAFVDKGQVALTAPTDVLTRSDAPDQVKHYLGTFHTDPDVTDK